MGDSGSSSSRAMEKLSLELSKYPRDLLQRFSSSSTPTQSQYVTPNQETEELELSLGLSLGGRFGVDKSSKKLTRASSIAGTFPLVRENSSNSNSNDASSLPRASHQSLMRTTSLPVETEEEWRKRKELQTLRRMAAKRRRCEKLKNRDGGGGGGGGERSLEGERREIEGLNLRYKEKINRFGSAAPPPWARGGALDVGPRGKCGQPSSQGSIESLGSSSGLSELEGKHGQGATSCETRSPISNQSIQDRGNQDALASSASRVNENARMEIENTFRQPNRAGSRGREIGLNAMEDMPSVSTKGEGPDGKRVEGILYKYGNGEEVKIMCICHGSFLTPAEFVKHGGGGDVDHPLRHIVVNHSPNPFL